MSAGAMPPTIHIEWLRSDGWRKLTAALSSWSVRRRKEALTTCYVVTTTTPPNGERRSRKRPDGGELVGPQVIDARHFNIEAEPKRPSRVVPDAMLRDTIVEVLPASRVKSIERGWQRTPQVSPTSC